MPQVTAKCRPVGSLTRSGYESRLESHPLDNRHRQRVTPAPSWISSSFSNPRRSSTFVDGFSTARVCAITDFTSPESKACSTSAAAAPTP